MDSFIESMRESGVVPLAFGPSSEFVRRAELTRGWQSRLHHRVDQSAAGTPIAAMTTHGAFN